jgi:hypothetical protein
MKYMINQFIGFLPGSAGDELSVQANLCEVNLSEVCRNYKIIDRV